MSTPSNVTPHEHEFEAAHGLPEPLPPDEHILWQGRPDWRTLAVEVMHVRTIAIYFAAMLLWRSGTVIYDGGSFYEAFLSILWLVPLSLVALGTLALMAWLTSQTTVYTLTDQRVVMRIGIVLSITFNLPYRTIASASLRAGPNGVGNIAIALVSGEDRIAYAHLWPHARPWKVKQTEPMLRAVPDALHVGRLLTSAIKTVPIDGQLVNALTSSRTGFQASATSQPVAGRSEPLVA